MIEYIQAVIDPDIYFARYALIAGILSSLSFGVIGTYVVVRRISYIAGAISHCVLAGIGACLYLQSKPGFEWCHPLYGAIISALASAFIIGFVSLYAEKREESVIGALWATGMATGLLFIAKTPGYVDPMSYLFGNILIISQQDLWLIAGLDVLVIMIAVLFYNKLLAVCLDHEYLKLRGVNAEFYFILLLCLTALTIVLLVNIVGIVMVIALLTLPASIAGFFSGKLWHIMLFAISLCAFFTITGLSVSYSMNLPSGPVIIVFSGAAYLLASIYVTVKRKLKYD